MMGDFVVMAYMDGKEIPCSAERFKLGMQEVVLVRTWEAAKLEAIKVMEAKGDDSVDFWRRMLDFEEIGVFLMNTRRALRDN